MPNYQYLCEKCDEAFEVWNTMSAMKQKEPCPTCGLQCQKIINTFGLYKIKGDNSGSTPPKSRVKQKD